MSETLRTMEHKKFPTIDNDKKENGYLVPIYNVHDHFFEEGKEPQQVYLTVVKPGMTKGPHLHFIRIGYFTCIKGNIKVVIQKDGEYQEYFSGEDHEYRSIEVPTGVPAMIMNIGEEDAYMINMPNPAWTPDMNDEHTADFSDYKGE